jgi:hypothetical protein
MMVIKIKSSYSNTTVTLLSVKTSKVAMGNKYQAID